MQFRSFFIVNCLLNFAQTRFREAYKLISKDSIWNG